MKLSDSQTRLLLAIAKGQSLKVHRDLEGGKVYKLHSLDGEAVEVAAADVEALSALNLIDSNKKFPVATFWLTEKGKAIIAELRGKRNQTFFGEEVTRGKFLTPTSSLLNQYPIKASTDVSNQLPLFDPKAAPSLDPSTPLEMAVAAWLDHLRQKDTSWHTLQAFSCDLNILLEYADPQEPLAKVTTAKLNAFLDWMRHERGKPCSDKTYGRRVTSLKAFFRWASPMAELRADPSETVLQLSVRSPLPEILTDEEVEKCLAAGEILRRGEKPDIRPLTLFTLLLITGMKKVEVANLKKDHIALAHPSDLHLYVRYPDKKDWPKERKLKLTPEWAEIYRDYLAEHAPKDDTVFPWSVRKLELALGEVGIAAGLSKSVSFDTMRWTCAVRDYKAKMEEDAIRRKMGLSPIQWRETSSRIKKLVEEGDMPRKL
jgi:integrase/recombinase XerD